MVSERNELLPLPSKQTKTGHAEINPISGVKTGKSMLLQQHPTMSSDHLIVHEVIIRKVLFHGTRILFRGYLHFIDQFPCDV